MPGEWVSFGGGGEVVSFGRGEVLKMACIFGSRETKHFFTFF